jgi:hypothetical protein
MNERAAVGIKRGEPVFFRSLRGDPNREGVFGEYVARGRCRIAYAWKGELRATVVDAAGIRRRKAKSQHDDALLALVVKSRVKVPRNAPSDNLRRRDRPFVDERTGARRRIRHIT